MRRASTLGHCNLRHQATRSWTKALQTDCHRRSIRHEASHSSIPAGGYPVLERLCGHEAQHPTARRTPEPQLLSAQVRSHDRRVVIPFGQFDPIDTDHLNGRGIRRIIVKVCIELRRAASAEHQTRYAYRKMYLHPLTSNSFVPRVSDHDTVNGRLKLVCSPQPQREGQPDRRLRPAGNHDARVLGTVPRLPLCHK